MGSVRAPGYDRRVRIGGPRAAVVLDAALAIALLGFGAWVVHQPEANGDGTVSSLLLVPLVAPIFARRRAPLAAIVAFAGGVVVSALPTFDQFRCGVAVPVALLLLFALAERRPLRPALAGLGLVFAALVFLCYTDQILEGDLAGFALFAFPLCGGIWGAGRVARSRDLVAAELGARSRLLERRREQTARLAVEVERTRLASDLDMAARGRVRDVIGLARAGEGLPPAHPDTQALFARIERQGRASLDEMRGLLGVLRTDERAERAPRPTLAQIETLLAEARAGGRLVDLAVEGERRTLPGGVELAAYRAIQHALVAVAGADSEPATVRLRYGREALELEVRGLARAGGGAEAALAAARERVTAHGGSFSARAPQPGRRILQAQLPLVAVGG
jgi:signal transduction histidine kinase